LEVRARLAAHADARLALGRRELASVARSVVFRDPARLVRTQVQRIDELAGRLRWALGGASKRQADRLASLAGRLQAGHPRNSLALARQRVGAIARQLENMSYRATLRRGFTVTRGEDGQILRTAEAVRAGDRIETEFTDGRVISLAGGRRLPARTPKRTRRPAPNGGPGLFDRDNDDQ